MKKSKSRYAQNGGLNRDGARNGTTQFKKGVDRRRKANKAARKKRRAYNLRKSK